MDYIHFHVADPATPWSHLFTTMEKIKNGNSVVQVKAGMVKLMTLFQDYSVSETTLEQIFLSFARTGEEDREGEGSKSGIPFLTDCLTNC